MGAVGGDAQTKGGLNLPTAVLALQHVTNWYNPHAWWAKTAIRSSLAVWHPVLSNKCPWAQKCILVVRVGQYVYQYYCLSWLELKQILHSLGYLLGCITIRILWKYSDDFGILILAYLVIIFVFKVIFNELHSIHF